MSRYITTESFFDPTTCETVVTFRIADSLVRIAPSSDSLAEAVEQARAAMLRACLVYGLDEDFIDAEVVGDVLELPVPRRALPPASAHNPATPTIDEWLAQLDTGT